MYHFNSLLKRLYIDTKSNFQELLRYSRRLSFSDPPQYSYLKVNHSALPLTTWLNQWYFQQLFHDSYESHGYSYDETELDWSSLSIPSNLYKANLSENSASSADTEDEINLEDEDNSSLQDKQEKDMD